MGKDDEVAIQLDEHGHAVGELETHPVDMVERLRMICRIFLVVFLVYFLITIIVQGVMLPMWFTSTPLAICFFAILIMGWIATRANSFLFANLMYWLNLPVSALVMAAILIWGLVKLTSGTGKYGKATLVPVVMLAIGILGAIFGSIMFFKYSRLLKSKR
jgi:hypothetical protein